MMNSLSGTVLMANCQWIGESPYTVSKRYKCKFN